MSAYQRKLVGSGATPMKAVPNPAPKTIELQPTQFASTWAHRPPHPVLVGLRVTSERDREGASIEALRSASERKLDDEERERVLADTFSRIIVARGICDPNNVLATHPLVPLPDDQIARAFPTSTIRWLFDEIDALNISQSPGYGEATDDELHKLSDILGIDSPLMGLSHYQEARVRRLLWAVLTEIES